jgi:hypothetical protein
MRAPTHRAEKYGKKIRGLVLPGQASRKAATVAREVELEVIVNRLVGFDISRGQYMIFAKQLNKLLGKYREGTLDGEVGILQDVWKARGLQEGLLSEIKAAVGYVIPTPAGPQICRFDIGKFDVDLFGV